MWSRSELVDRYCLSSVEFFDNPLGECFVGSTTVFWDQKTFDKRIAENDSSIYWTLVGASRLY